MTKIVAIQGAKKGGGGAQRVAVEAPDSLRSKQYARVLDAVSEGEIEGLVDGARSIFLDDTPLQNEDGTFNFDDVVIEARNGSQAQTYIPGFDSVEVEVPVSVEVTSGATGVVRTISNPNTDAVRVTVGVPQLTHQDMSNGDLNGTSVELSVDVQTAGGGFVTQPVGIAVENMTVSGMIASMPNLSTRVRLRARWTASRAPGASGICTFTLWRREIGAATWTKVKDGKLSQSINSVTGSLRRGSSLLTYLAGVSDNVALDLPSAKYEFWLEKLSGDGILGISGNYDVPTNIITISGKTTSRYQRSFRVSLSGEGPWDVRVRRITEDSSSASLVNKTFWDSYTEVVEQKLSYPNTALIGISIDASQFQSIPARGYEMKLLKVPIPNNYDPITRTYTGEWDGGFAPAAWTDNPVWCWNDMVTNERYGLGEFINAGALDKWELYRIAKYCDELVPTGYDNLLEPRFSCNLYLQTREEAYKVIGNMASIFRAMTYWASGSVVAVQDSPSDPVALFAAANVIDGLFNYSGSALKARHTVAKVTWNDPANAYKQNIEYVEDQEGIERYGIVETDFVAAGCTSKGQAYRAGKWLLYSERLETEMVSFTTGLEGAVVYPGAIIKTQDSARSGKRFGGRVKSAPSGTVVEIDGPITYETGKTYTLTVMLPDGTVEERPVSGTGTTTYLAADPPFSAAPQAGSMWVLAASDLTPELWRVISVAERAKGQVEVAALRHYPQKYALVENDTAFEIPTTSAINVTPPPTDEVSAIDSIYLNGSGISTKLSVSWAAIKDQNGALSAQIRGYVVRYRRMDGIESWTQIPERQETSVDIHGVIDGKTYEIRVYSVNALGVTSKQYGSVSHLVLGKKTPPADVTGLSVEQRSTGVVLRWTNVADVDLAQYEVRRGTAWETATVVGRAKATSMSIPPMLVGNYTWLVKAVDTTKNYSTNAASVTLAIEGPGISGLTTDTSGKDYVLSWSTSASAFAIDYYEIRHGSDITNTDSITKTKALSYKAPIDWLGDRVFWVRAVDVAGNAGPLTSATLSVGIPAAPSVQATLVMAKVQLEWTRPISSISIAEYEIRRGATWFDGVGSTKITGTSIRLPIDWLGDRTFWVAAIDSNGNVGPASSVSVSISAPAAPMVSGELSAEQTILTWAEAQSSIPIAEYELGYGVVSLGRVKGTTFSFKADWVGNRDFWVRGFDLNGNMGAKGNVSLNVTAPSAPALTQQTIDNNVLLYWSGSSGSLPVVTYELRKGATWETATLIGQKSGGFTTVFETVSGMYTYWVAGIDSAGNYGVPASVVTAVSQPPDYLLLADHDTTFQSTALTTVAMSNALLEAGGVVMPINTAESWEQHFTANAWASPDEQVAAGYPVYVQPGVLTGYYEETIDYGAVLAATKISVTPNDKVVAGTPTAECTISTSPDGINWTDHVGTWQVFATNFRYGKVRISVTGDLHSIYKLDALNVKLDVKLKNDAGIAYANAADTGGTQVDFTAGVGFLDVTSITVTAQGTTPLVAIYDFVDTPSPTGFKVLLFDMAGVRQSGNVSWSVKGY